MKALKLTKTFSYPKNIKTTLCKLSESNVLISRYLCCIYYYYYFKCNIMI